MQRTLLVTGGCGYIGSHVVAQLSERGYRVVVLDDLSTGFRDALLHGERLVEGSMGDERVVEALLGEYPFDAVLHFAGSIVVPESVSDPIKYYENNTVNTLRLLRQCLRYNVKRFLFSSTAVVYGEFSEPVLLREDMPQRPVNPYAKSKVMVEWMLEDLKRSHGLQSTVLRYFNVAGADPQLRLGQRSPKATHLIKVAAEVVAGKRRGVEIFGGDYPTHDGTCIRDYIHIADLASAHVVAVEKMIDENRTGTFNVGYGKGSSVKEVLAAVKRVGGMDFPTPMAPRRPGDTPSLVADVSKIQKELGWRPQYDNLDLIVKHAIEWEKKLAR